MPNFDPEDVYDLLDSLDLEPTQRISTLISALEESLDAEQEQEDEE